MSQLDSSSFSSPNHPAFTASLPFTFTRSVSLVKSLTPHRLPIPPRPPATLRSRRPSPSPHIAWLISSPSLDIPVLFSANTASFHVLRTTLPLSHVLHLARQHRVSTVHVHFKHPQLQLARSRFIASAIQLVVVGVPDHVPSRAITPLAATAAVSVLVETKDDTITQYTAGNNDRLEQLTNIDDRPFWDRFVAWIIRVYLPQGFPHTTTPDYISFTKFRTLQNLASAIMTVISTEALLFGLGLGKKVAAGAAATSWVLKDGASYVAKILYGSIFGSRFDDDPKSWRIASDIVEDLGGAIEILTPLFPLSYFLPLASIAVCLKGCAGMTGTATRHVVYRSLAASGMQNTGDIATKGESQSGTMKVLGTALGILISSKIGQRYYALLAAYSTLGIVHIIANWKSVQCVQFSFFNKQRASILIENHIKGLPIPSPLDVSRTERVILPPWKGFEPNVKIGGKALDAVDSFSELDKTIRICKGEQFLVFYDSKTERVRVLLGKESTSEDALRAYYTVKQFMLSNGQSGNDLQSAVKCMKKNIRSFKREAVSAGWDLKHMLLTDDRTKVYW